MESHSSATPRGEGVSTPHETLEQTLAPDTSASQRCLHVSPAGRHCRMLSADESGLCAYHALPRFTAAAPNSDSAASISEETANELLADIKDFKSPAAVNQFLGNVVEQVVRRKVSRRDAITLAYLSQLILNSQSAMVREQIAKAESKPQVINWVDFLAKKPADTQPPRQTSVAPTQANNNRL